MGICYGLQLLVHSDGGKIVPEGQGEYGFAKIDVQVSEGILEGIKSSIVWMSHGDRVEVVPPEWRVLANSSNGIIAAMANYNQTRVATQFHPEVYHTEKGSEIICNFLFKIAKCKKNWTTGNFIDEQVGKIKKKVGSGHVITGVSGGVDSSVVAALLHKAIGEHSHSVIIDNGLMRKNEVVNCVESLKNGLGVNIDSYDESDNFLSGLDGVIDPEKKRKIIGAQFIRSFERIAKDLGDIKFLAQGTLYPDVIESGLSKGNTAHVIKSHHNVGGIPDNINVEIIEPLRELFKDEVRKIGIELGLPELMVYRHPFPGPGLGVRILGEVKPEFAQLLQLADDIFIKELVNHDLYNKTSQAFAVFLPIKSVGVMGDGRRYDYVIALRAVETVDFMTARWARLPYEFLEMVSLRIINEIEGISRVTYDISGKPPATIEWE